MVSVQCFGMLDQVPMLDAKVHWQHWVPLHQNDECSCAWRAAIILSSHGDPLSKAEGVGGGLEFGPYGNSFLTGPEASENSRLVGIVTHRELITLVATYVDVVMRQ